jgi:hypothetical protein
VNVRLAPIFTAVLLCVGIAQAQVAGRVVDSAGKPLADVRVFSGLWEDVRTDASGRFHMSRPDLLVRFSKEGYNPTTISTGAITNDIVLKSTTSSWRPPVCSRSAAGRFGERMRFAYANGTRLITGSDIDYRTVSVRFAGATLTFGTGPHWTSGLPSPSVLKEADLEERDVWTPWGSPAAEYRGRGANGTHWRLILIMSESIGYDGASAAAATRFDAIIDSVCFNAATNNAAPSKSE